METHWSSDDSSTPYSRASTPVTTPGFGSEQGDGNQIVGNTALDGNVNVRGARFTLVIGGLGFIGSHTSLELLKAGHNVIIVDDLSNSFEDVFSKIQKLASEHCAETNSTMPMLHFHKLDYRSQSMRFLLESYSTLVSVPSSHGSPRLSRQSHISGVIHFAAFKSVPDSIAKPIPYYRNNVCGLVDLMDLLGKNNIRNFVFSSSATVYGNKADLGRPLREEDLVHHVEPFIDDTGRETLAEPMSVGLQSPYARTKHFCEAILADIAVSDPSWRIVALRYFNPIGCDPSGLLGEDPKGVPTNLFPVITQVLTGSRPELDVFGSDWNTRDGTAIRDFVHVSDVAVGHVKALASPAKVPFRTFNLGSGTGTTVQEAVQSLEQAASKSIPVRLTDRRAGDVGFCVASNDRAFRELGWTAERSIPQCARDLWHFVTKTKSATS
ncbi:hypothetical protein NLU13_6548 [Sarocladium strictum]|uniref:NAD-dependent epimerase/dehydratase domain-containing protein n=1 Tax=Sarocladium strictum TaxID=5046 RepID=A0AA39GHE1_SARSR|nr:hypothetical protein NLU13_6548 [Sarocladium strictum]